MMTTILWAVIGVLLVLLLVQFGAMLWQKRNILRTMKTLDVMLEEAIEGRFEQQRFDETRLSALENRLETYLTTSSLSARNLQLEKEKIEELITDISHQVKTPIANILLYSQLLEEQQLSLKAAKCAYSIKSQGEKLDFLMDFLIKLSRLETGMFSFSPKSLPVQPMLEEMQTQYWEKAQKKKLSLEIENIEVTAFFDAKWTSEALGNILDNAIKYTPFGGNVTVRATSYELFCRIDIQDTGPGIAEEEKAKIFSRFYRSPALKEQEGIGVGLYLAREIISQQGGYIKVTSKIGKGSCFSVFLPLEQ